MAVPSSYTEADFKQYLHDALGPVSTALGWEVAGGQYDEPLNDALFNIGETVITAIDSTNIAGFRVLGRLMTWRKVLSYVSGDFDFVDEGEDLKRSQVQKMALDNIAQLESESSDAGVGGGVAEQVTAGTVLHTHNPYRHNEET